jgi:hypothetical protein
MYRAVANIVRLPFERKYANIESSGTISSRVTVANEDSKAEAEKSLVSEGSDGFGSTPVGWVLSEVAVIEEEVVADCVLQADIITRSMINNNGKYFSIWSFLIESSLPINIFLDGIFSVNPKSSTRKYIYQLSGNPVSLIRGYRLFVISISTEKVEKW